MLLFFRVVYFQTVCDKCDGGNGACRPLGHWTAGGGLTSREQLQQQPAGRHPETECCHAECAGGCTGPLASQCDVCRNVIHEGECRSSCPPDFYLVRRPSQLVTIASARPNETATLCGRSSLPTWQQAALALLLPLVASTRVTPLLQSHRQNPVYVIFVNRSLMGSRRPLGNTRRHFDSIRNVFLDEIERDSSFSWVLFYKAFAARGECKSNGFAKFAVLSVPGEKVHSAASLAGTILIDPAARAAAETPCACHLGLPLATVVTQARARLSRRTCDRAEFL